MIISGIILLALGLLIGGILGYWLGENIEIIDLTPNELLNILHHSILKRAKEDVSWGIWEKNNSQIEKLIETEITKMKSISQQLIQECRNYTQERKSNGEE